MVWLYVISRDDFIWGQDFWNCVLRTRLKQFRFRRNDKFKTNRGSDQWGQRVILSSKIFLTISRQLNLFSSRCIVCSAYVILHTSYHSCSVYRYWTVCFWLFAFIITTATPFHFVSNYFINTSINKSIFTQHIHQHFLFHAHFY